MEMSARERRDIIYQLLFEAPTDCLLFEWTVEQEILHLLDGLSMDELEFAADDEWIPVPVQRN